MKRAAIVLICYLVSLLVFSLFFSWLGVKEFKPNPSTLKTLQHPMMIVTIIAGLTALRFTVSARSFKIFLLAYIGLWILRIPVNYLIENAANIEWLQNKGYDKMVNHVLFKYYDGVTRICTPLPFIIYWFILYFFELINKRFSVLSSDKKTGTENESPLLEE